MIPTATHKSRSMSTLADTFDPWGPVSVALFATGNADIVEDAVAGTGLLAQGRRLSREEAYSHGTRIRARKPEISAAYYDLPGEHRGTFVQQLLKALFDRPDGEAIRTQLEARLQPIGWTVTSDGLLVPRMPWSPRPTSPQLHL